MSGFNQENFTKCAESIGIRAASAHAFARLCYMVSRETGVAVRQAAGAVKHVVHTAIDTMPEQYDAMLGGNHEKKFCLALVMLNSSTSVVIPLMAATLMDMISTGHIDEAPEGVVAPKEMYEEVEQKFYC